MQLVWSVDSEKRNLSVERPQEETGLISRVLREIWRSAERFVQCTEKYLEISKSEERCSEDYLKLS